jgi:phospholipid-binding lipoprotein MlaA
MHRGLLLCAALALCTAAAGAAPLEAAATAPAQVAIEEASPPVDAAVPEPAGGDPTAEVADDLLADDPLLDDDLDVETGGVRDPLEGMNRRVFVFNCFLDDYGWSPLTAGYKFVVPESARRGIHRAFQNIGTPVLFVNQMLQLRVVDGAKTLGRFVLNTTVGLMGFFDPAADGAGWERRSGDFGQTLATYGVKSGPYLMIPIFGPNTARDAVGGVFDFALDPMLYIVGPLEWFVLLGTSEGLAQREANAEALTALEESSVDYYAALRSAYLQARTAELIEGIAKSDSYVLMR